MYYAIASATVPSLGVPISTACPKTKTKSTTSVEAAGKTIFVLSIVNAVPDLLE